MSEFELAAKVAIKHEGYKTTNHPADKGGLTKYGISSKTYPDLDVEKLTIDDARELYRKDWWDRYEYGRINSQDVATKIFVLAINTGPAMAHRIVQRALRATQDQVVEDGVLGPVTLRTINRADSISLLCAIRSEAAGYYRTLVVVDPTQKVFLQGWLNRAYA